MKIKEVEELLSVSRANIRFYEKEGLLTPNRETNNYRDYSEENIKELKKIILFRKLGFTIEEIKKLQKGEINLKEASADNIARLESEIESLKGALNLTQKLADEQTDFDAIDENHYLEILSAEENQGAKFADILKDYLTFETEALNLSMKFVFLTDFKRIRKKHGILFASILFLFFCVLGGIGEKFLRHGSFWKGFFEDIFMLGGLFLFTSTLYVLHKISPKIGSFVLNAILILCLLFLGGIFLLIIILLLNQLLHFWF